MIKFLLYIIFVLVLLLLPTLILILYNYVDYFYKEYKNIKERKRDFNANPITIGEVHNEVINSFAWKWDFRLKEYKDDDWAGNSSYLPIFSHIWLVIKTVYLIVKGILILLNYIFCKKLHLDNLLFVICKFIYKYIIIPIHKLYMFIYRKLYNIYDIIRQKIWNIKI